MQETTLFMGFMADRYHRNLSVMDCCKSLITSRDNNRYSIHYIYYILYIVFVMGERYMCNKAKRENQN